MATQEDTLNFVRSLVWSGEFDEAEVALHIYKRLNSEVDKGWLLDAIQREFQSKRKAEETWPKVTDFDRLDRAFTLLDAQGIIALHRAGFTQSDGFEDVDDAYTDAGGKKSEYKGYCFYTEQDQEVRGRNRPVHRFRTLLGNRGEGRQGRTNAACRLGAKRVQRGLGRDDQDEGLCQGFSLAATQSELAPPDQAMHLPRPAHKLLRGA